MHVRDANYGQIGVPSVVAVVPYVIVQVFVVLLCVAVAAQLVPDAAVTATLTLVDALNCAAVKVVVYVW